MKQMVDLKILNVLARNHVYFCIPFRIKTEHRVKLLALQLRERGKIFSIISAIGAIQIILYKNRKKF